MDDEFSDELYREDRGCKYKSDDGKQVKRMRRKVREKKDPADSDDGTGKSAGNNRDETDAKKRENDLC